MSRIVAMFVFEVFYLFAYCIIPIAIISTLLNYVKIPLMDFILAPLGLILVLLSFYRTKLAVDAFGDGDMKFLDAHRASGVVFRSHLSFLPIIGKLFEKKIH